MEKILKNSLEEVQNFFNSLGIRYTMKTMRYCAEKNIDLSMITAYSPKNLLDLIMMGTPSISVEEADLIITKWYEKGLSFPLLHTLAVKEARESGFFITEADTAIMGQMDTQNLDVLKTILPTVTQELQVLTNFQDSMKNSL